MRCPHMSSFLFFIFLVAVYQHGLQPCHLFICMFFQELCLFLIPLINREKLWAVASVVLRYARIWLLGVVASLCSPYNRLRAAMHRVRAENTASAGDETDGGQLCTACQQVPAVPYVANCSHTFCYSCVRVRTWCQT